MEIGMLWFDNDPTRDLEAKVSRAVQHYQRKYGRAPDLCIVHPNTAGQGGARAGGVSIQTSKSVLPNHFWIGLRES